MIIARVHLIYSSLNSCPHRKTYCVPPSIGLRGYVTPNAYSALTEDVTKFGTWITRHLRQEFSVQGPTSPGKFNLPNFEAKRHAMQCTCGSPLWDNVIVAFVASNTFGGGQSTTQPILICGSTPFVAGLGHFRGESFRQVKLKRWLSKTGLPAARLCMHVSTVMMGRGCRGRDPGVGA
jgi:hypothetical protein